MRAQQYKHSSESISGGSGGNHLLICVIISLAIHFLFFEADLRGNLRPSSLLLRICLAVTDEGSK